MALRINFINGEFVINIFKKNRTFLLVVATLVLCILLTWINTQFSRMNSGGVDFATNWMATRTFITEGQSPYSSAASQNILEILQSQGSDNASISPKFTLPLYGMLVFSPFALIKNYVLARALWMTLLEICIVAIIILSMQLSFWKINPILLISLFLFGLFGFHGI